MEEIKPAQFYANKFNGRYLYKSWPNFMRISLINGTQTVLFESWPNSMRVSLMEESWPNSMRVSLKKEIKPAQFYASKFN